MAASDTSKDDDDLADAEEAFKLATDAWSDNYNDALEDMRFVSLNEHWPEPMRRQRELDGRPCLTIPLLPPIIRQVVNDGRQNKPGITVHPADDKADPHTAELMNGLIRQIERSSHADVAYDTGLEHAAKGGFGWLKINTRYASDDSFEQDLIIETVANAFSILPDPDSTAADSSDWDLAFEIDSLAKKAFEKKWKDADPVSFDGRGIDRKPVNDGERVQIAYQWTREEDTRQIVALSAPAGDADPSALAQADPLVPESMVVDLKVYEANKALFDAIGVHIIGQPRTVASHKVTRRTLSGADVLERLEWAGKWIPIVPIYGNDINIEGVRYLSGLVRDAKDEQRRYNFHMTSATENTALAPKTPFTGAKGSFVTDAEKWATANTQNHAYIEYDVVPGAPPPQRQQFAGVPIGDFQMAQSANEGVKSITGIHNASLGAPSNETSGRAIMARQREGDVGAFHYTDNLNRAMRHAGEILLDLIPKVYSTPRIVRIIGPKGDDDVQRVPINQPTTIQAKDPDTGQLQDIEHIYDLGLGKYDLIVKPGPSFTSRREEAATQMMALIQAYPAAAPVIGDLLAKNLDWPGADEIAERLKMMLPAQLQGDSPAAQEAQAQMQKMAQIIGELRGKLMAAEADHSIDQQTVNVDKMNAETNRLKALVGKDGAPYAADQVAPAVVATLVHIMSSPDLLEAAQNGAPMDQVIAQLQQRMQAAKPAPNADPTQPPALAAA